jgi:hypothetical protein
MWRRRGFTVEAIPHDSALLECSGGIFRILRQEKLKAASKITIGSREATVLFGPSLVV